MVALVLPHAAERAFGAPRDLRYWSGVEEQVHAVLAPPVEAKGHPAKRKKVKRGLGS